MTPDLAKFRNAFSDGLPFEDAAREAGFPPTATLAEYWNVLVMEDAVAKSRDYFDQLIHLVH